MSLGTAEPASETGDDSLSAITFDSDSDAKAKKKSFHKPPPTSLKSPYHSKPRKVASWRSLRTAASMPLGGRMSLTPQKLCLGSSKQGSLTPALTSDLTLDCAWTHSPSSAPDFVTEALRMKRSNLRRSASHGYVPGNPVYREKEDMYDEIIELKKSLNVQKSDVDLMRTKLRRLEEENSRKDRQIEQLLDASRGPDFVRTLAEKRPDAGWVINGLKQRVLKLEQQCKEKDNVINKLQTDVKTTNLEEMRIAMETYYEEIHRLHGLLASSEMTGKRPPVEKKIGLKRQKKMSSALLSLSRSVQELTEENQSLKEDLDRMLSNSPTASKIKAGYVDWSKPRLVRRIAELEKKLSSMESPKAQASEAARSTSLTPSASSPTLHLQENERLRGAVKSLKGERSALHTQLQERDPRKTCLSPVHLWLLQVQFRDAVSQALLLRVWPGGQQPQRHTGPLRGLQFTAEGKSFHLQWKSNSASMRWVYKHEESFCLWLSCLEVKQLLQTKAELEKDLESMKEGERERREREKALREEVQALTRKFQELEGRKKDEEDEPVAVAPETHEEPSQPPSPTASPSQPDAEPDWSQGGSSRPPSTCSEGRRDEAARVLQRRWKGYQHQAATVLQAAFRGHLARARLLSSTACVSEPPRVPSPPTQDSPEPRIPSPAAQAEGDPWQEEAVTIIQSAFRAHLARARHSTPGSEASTAAVPDRPARSPATAPSSPPCPAAGPGQGDSEGSSRETAKGPAPEDGVLRPPPCSAEPPVSGLQPTAPTPAEDVNSDDSDEIVLAPSLPTRKSACLP
ncbi:IQ domain-containing protein E isoform X4 [Bubalus bubalis]|uniref:IQ domain-containing protein E isoform X4 n=1 Tax=Bubalus bubalis TaxID=89462 RepID=UPI001E1B8727|nr:IQ domain-containing protein E isoform X4 [Bubalus bubalis]